MTTAISCDDYYHYFHDDPANLEVPAPVGPPAIFFKARPPRVAEDDDAPQDGQRGSYFHESRMADLLRDRGVERDE